MLKMDEIPPPLFFLFTSFCHFLSFLDFAWVTFVSNSQIPKHEKNETIFIQGMNWQEASEHIFPSS